MRRQRVTQQFSQAEHNITQHGDLLGDNVLSVLIFLLRISLHSFCARVRPGCRNRAILSILANLIDDLKVSHVQLANFYELLEAHASAALFDKVCYGGPHRKDGARRDLCVRVRLSLDLFEHLQQSFKRLALTVAQISHVCLDRFQVHVQRPLANLRLGLHLGRSN